MSTDALVKIDGIKWQIAQTSAYGQVYRVPVPLCPKHNLRLQPMKGWSSSEKAYAESGARELRCEECPVMYKIPREFHEEKRYVIDKVDSRAFRQMQTINLDDEAVPLASGRIESKDSPYWLEAKLVESKAGGPKVVIYAGDKRRRNKTQLFVDPATSRMGFDQNDSHPADVFVSVEATFKDGTKTAISGG